MAPASHKLPRKGSGRVSSLCPSQNLGAGAAGRCVDHTGRCPVEETLGRVP